MKQRRRRYTSSKERSCNSNRHKSRLEENDRHKSRWEDDDRRKSRLEDNDRHKSRFLEDNDADPVHPPDVAALLDTAMKKVRIQKIIRKKRRHQERFKQEIMKAKHKSQEEDAHHQLVFSWKRLVCCSAHV
jgi:hypothetical protein